MAEPPKARIGALLDAVEQRLFGVGLGGLGEVVELATAAAREVGLADPRVTSDAKHVEIGLTDKSDAGRWIIADLWACGVGPGLVLVGGDEFRSSGGLPGSDSLMLVERAQGATAVSVGVEPQGVPDGVHTLGGGPAAFLELLRDQHEGVSGDGEPPAVDEQPAWSVVVDRLDVEHERADETFLTIGWLARDQRDAGQRGIRRQFLARSCLASTTGRARKRACSQVPTGTASQASSGRLRLCAARLIFAPASCERSSPVT